MCKEGWGSALQVLVLAEYSMSSPMIFSSALTCSVSPEDVPVGLLMYKILWTNSIYWIPFLEGHSAAQCRREAEGLVHHVPLTFLLSFVHLRAASKGWINPPLPCGFWQLIFSTKQSFVFYAVVLMIMYYLSQYPLIHRIACVGRDL